jgi:RNA polymerase sigma-70 factor, ECF subfamily
MRGKTDSSDALSRELAEARFVELYEDHAREVLAYALRRASTAQDAADVVADVYLVAWRRIGEVPRGGDARLWLYGVARLTLANQRRGESRRARLAERLRAELSAAAQAAQPAEAGSSALLRALSTLGEEDREVLLLTGWEELEPGEIATVLDVSGVTVRSRLHRARRRLRRAIEEQDAGVLRAEVELGCGEAR